MRGAVLLVLSLAVALGQQPDVSATKLIQQRIGKLRSLDDDARAVETKAIAREIRSLPAAGGELGLALALSNLATEGDFGRDTLREVGLTILDGVRKNPRGADEAFDELARLAHYEGVDLGSDDPRFRGAIAKLEATDKVRAESDFSLKDLAGKQWTLKQLSGRVVLVNFWATWCPPCRKEMPDLESLYRRFADKGLVILAISDEDEAKVRPFIVAQKYSYPVLLDPDDVVNKRFLIQGIPKSLVFDRAGKLVAQSSDMRTMGQFLGMLRLAGLE